MLLAALLLVWLPAVPARGRAGEAARVEVLEGRALLAGAGAVARLQAGGPERAIEGPAHLELPAGSRARVTWTGRASLVLEGRNVLAWHPGEDGAAPAWDLAEIGLAHLELRHGPLDLALDGGWRARVYGGACALRGLPGEGVELEHQAGLPFDLWPPERDGEPSAPFSVLAGARVRLLGGTARPLALQGSQGRLRDPHQQLGCERAQPAQAFPAWSGFAWPWAPRGSAVPHGISARGPDLPSVPYSAGSHTSLALDLPERDAPAPRAPAIDALVPDAVPAAQDTAVAPAAVLPADSAPAASAPATNVPESSPAGAPLEAPVPPPVLESKLRERGVLVLTPYGPRWLDATRAVDPALPRMQAARRRP